ncbi:DNA-formamidopyrimidine glycosylase family protein [Cellulomonas chengniuliangii]|uniref:DNA-formamidopyrimidine glycosylase family protein n=1 Tax=Cellulomonas chengniuliangii TaxID=2968084 RepID=UPI001D0F0281|nr:DNA-formamidopyrimidine glycosylase family protein [Cellulomonas chengniuliangii]MCC2319256.1 Fpg/Nei family DNA glycosylase [Cellulomonas chengniuliangii]
MPEGDIVRRTAARLDQALAGRPLTRAELRWPSAAGADLTGRTVVANVPYGKHLLTRLDDGRTLHTHLRMEGRWSVERTGSRGAAGSGASVRAILGNETWTVLGKDLGMLDVLATRDEHQVIGHLGPDLLADDFPRAGLPEALRRWADRGPQPVADVLLDQRVVAGIGTIFMAESLFARGLWPWTPADEVPEPAHLLGVARRLMQRSVAATVPGSTGESGPGAQTLVHGRAGKPCRRCGAPIQVGEARPAPFTRPVFYCARCQTP